MSFFGFFDWVAGRDGSPDLPVGEGQAPAPNAPTPSPQTKAPSPPSPAKGYFSGIRVPEDREFMVAAKFADGTTLELHDSNYDFCRALARALIDSPEFDNVTLRERTLIEIPTAGYLDE